MVFLGVFTALAMRYEAARVRTDPEHADPELRSILSHGGGMLMLSTQAPLKGQSAAVCRA